MLTIVNIRDQWVNKLYNNKINIYILVNWHCTGCRNFHQICYFADFDKLGPSNPYYKDTVFDLESIKIVKKKTLESIMRFKVRQR